MHELALLTQVDNLPSSGHLMAFHACCNMKRSGAKGCSQTTFALALCSTANKGCGACFLQTDGCTVVGADVLLFQGTVAGLFCGSVLAICMKNVLMYGITLSKGVFMLPNRDIKGCCEAPLCLTFVTCHCEGQPRCSEWTGWPVWRVYSTSNTDLRPQAVHRVHQSISYRHGSAIMGPPSQILDMPHVHYIPMVT